VGAQPVIRPDSSQRRDSFVEVIAKQEPNSRRTDSLQHRCFLSKRIVRPDWGKFSRQNLSGYRGFESTPLHHTVCTVWLQSGDSAQSAPVVPFLLREGTGEGESFGICPHYAQFSRWGSSRCPFIRTSSQPAQAVANYKLFAQAHRNNRSPRHRSHLLRDGLLRPPGVTHVLARSVTHVPRTYNGKGSGVRAPQNFHYGPIPCSHSVKPKDQSSAMVGSPTESGHDT